MFAADDQSFFVEHSENGEPSALYRENLQTGQRTLLAKNGLGDVATVEYSAWPATPFAVSFETGVRKPVYIDSIHQMQNCIRL